MRVETVKASWKDMFSSQGRRGEVARKLCENLVLRARLKKSMCDACSTRKGASKDTLFDMLGYRTLLSRNSTVGMDILQRIWRQRLHKK